MNIKHGIIASLFLAISGCASLPPKIVNVPVYEPIKFTMPEKPKLLSATLNSKSSVMTVEKAHIVDIIALTNYSRQLENLLITIRDEPK